MQEKQIVINSLLLTYYYQKASTQKRGVVLFLHGWGSNSTLWFQSTERLQNEGFDLYYLDLPGFGKSQNPKEAFSMQDYSYVVLEFMEKLDLRNVHLVGHSFGGKTAIKLGAANPELLHTITLVDASGIPHHSAITDAKIMVAKMIKPAFSLSFMHPLKKKLVNKFGAEDYTANPALKQTFINVVEEDMRPALKSIQKPTLIVWGKNDENSYTPVSDANLMHHEVKNSELVVIDHAGHYPFLDQPGAFEKALSAFLKKNA